MWTQCASRYFVIDPLKIKERLSVISLSHLTYLKAKAVRDNSMSGKVRNGEAAYPSVRRGSVVMVKWLNCLNPSVQNATISTWKNSGKTSEFRAMLYGSLKAHPGANPKRRGGTSETSRQGSPKSGQHCGPLRNDCL